MITVKAIAYRTKPKAPMIELEQVEITCESGVVPDCRAGGKSLC